MTSFGLLTRVTVAAAALAGIGVMASAEGCGPGDTRYYCDSSGCYNCDGYGCHPVNPPNPTTCTGDKSCLQNQICTTKGCATICKADTDCAQGQTCQNGLCSAPTVTPGDPLQCTTKADCSAGEECVGNKCQACGGTNGPCSCGTNADCSGGQVCAGGLCTDPSNACKYSSECGQGKVCADGECLVDCSQGQACPQGMSCSSKGVCEPSGNQCTSDAQCSGGTPKCVQGQCAAACDPNNPVGPSACPNGEYCDQGACVPDTRPSPNCGGTGQQCLANQQCVDGFCRYSCTTDQECKLIDARIGYCAADQTCRDAQEANPQCLSSSDCPSGQSCISNQCK
jgi:Cys-rich repeat protein